MRKTRKRILFAAVMMLCFTFLSLFSHAVNYQSYIPIGNTLAYNLYGAPPRTWPAPTLATPYSTNQYGYAGTYPHDQPGVPGFITLNWREGTAVPGTNSYDTDAVLIVKYYATKDRQGNDLSEAQYVYTEDLVATYTLKDGYTYTKSASVNPTTGHYTFNKGTTYSAQQDERSPLSDYNYFLVRFVAPQSGKHVFIIVDENDKEYRYEYVGSGDKKVIFDIKNDFVNDVVYDGTKKVKAVKFQFYYQNGTHINNFRICYIREFGLFQSGEAANVFPDNFDALTPAANVTLKTGTPDLSVAVIPSVKNISHNPTALSDITSWIAANKSAQNIRFATLVGKATRDPDADYNSLANIYKTDQGGRYSADANQVKYLVDLVKDPTMLTSLGTSTAKLHESYHNLAAAMKTVSDAGIPFSIAMSLEDIPYGLYRGLYLSDIFFRLRPSDPAALSAATTGMSYTYENRTVMFPVGTKGTDFDQYEAKTSYSFTALTSDGIENTWQILSSGDEKYLVITTECYPTKGVRTWIKGLLESHPDKRAIICLTGYMDIKGRLFTIWDDDRPELLSSTSGVGIPYASPPIGSTFEVTDLAGNILDSFVVTGTKKYLYYYTTGLKTNMWNQGTDGIMLWDKVFSQYENVFLIIDGGTSTNHTYDTVTSDTATSFGNKYNNDIIHRIDTGIHGNTVHTLQANPGSLLLYSGAVMMLRFFNEDNQIEVSYYSPSNDAYINPTENVFTFQISPRYSVTCPEEVTVSASEGAPGETIIASYTPAAGKKLRVGSFRLSYTLDQVPYRKSIFPNQDGTFSFTLPKADVVILVDSIDEDEPNFATVGAGVRIPQSGVKTGIRFKTIVNLDCDYTLIEEGTLLIPSSMLTRDSDLTLGAENVLKIKRVNYYSWDVTAGRGQYEFTGVLTDVPVRKYSQMLSARSYIKYKKPGDETEYTLYSDIIERSIAGVAQAAIDSGNESEENVAFLETLLGYAGFPVETFDEPQEALAASLTEGSAASLSVGDCHTDLFYGLQVAIDGISSHTRQKISLTDAGKVADTLAELENFSYFRFWFDNPNEGTINLGVELGGEYLNTAGAKLFDQYGTALTPQTGGANTSLTIPGGFEGWIFLDIPSAAASGSGISFDISLQEGKQYAYYVIDSIYLANELTVEPKTPVIAGSETTEQQKVQIARAMNLALHTPAVYREIPAYHPSFDPVTQAANAAAYNHIKAITYDGLLYDGSKTKVFAYIGFPEGASAENPVPAVVLVHGGGGHPYMQWIKIWNDLGYAAIAMDTTGYYPSARNVGINESQNSLYVYGMNGNPDFYEEGYVNAPNRSYVSSYAPVDKQWSYHGISQVILAHNLLRQDPRVDNDNIGITGISWGGVLTSLVIGYDTRYSFAIPIYGSGYLSETVEGFGFRTTFAAPYTYALWTAEHRFDRVNFPVLWLCYNDDNNFTINANSLSYKATVRNNEKTALSMLGSWGHSHGTGWSKDISYVFANSITFGTTGLVSFATQPTAQSLHCRVNIPAGATNIQAKIFYLTAPMSCRVFDKMGWGNAYTFLDQYWQTNTTDIAVNPTTGAITGTIPSDAAGYYIGVSFTVDGKTCEVSSEWIELT